MNDVDAMDAESGIRAVLDSLSRAYLEGADPTVILDLMYEPDVIVVGEGEPGATRGIPVLEEKARAISAAAGPHPKVFFSVCMPIQACGDTAVTMVGAEIHPDLPDAEIAYSRFLAGWRKGARGWRICMEMHAEGRL